MLSLSFIQIKIKGIIGNGVQSDIALDNIVISHNNTCENIGGFQPKAGTDGFDSIWT